MAVDMFLKLGDIKGESEDKDKKDWIEVLAWSWGMSQSGTMHTGTGGGTGKVSVQDISLTKYVDKSTPDIMKKVSNGEHYAKAELVVRKAGKEPLEYIKWTFTDVIVTSYNTGGGGEEQVTENLTLNFRKYRCEYQAQDNTTGKKKGGPVPVEYDIAKNETVA